MPAASLGELCIPSHPAAALPGNEGTATSQPWERVFGGGKACAASERGEDPLRVFWGKSGGVQRATWCSLLPHVGGRTFLSPDPAVGNSTPLLHLLLPPQASVRALQEGGREGDLVRGQALPSHSPSPADSTVPPSTSAGTPGPSPTHARLSVGSRARDFSSSMISLYFEPCPWPQPGRAVASPARPSAGGGGRGGRGGGSHTRIFPAFLALVLRQCVGHRAGPHPQSHVPPSRINPGLAAPPPLA